MEILVCMVCSVVVSAVITKMLATRYFEIVDGYVEGVVDDAKRIMAENFSRQDRL